MATSAPLEPTYEVPPHVDITRLALTQEEGVVVARMLGRRVTLRELVSERVVAAADGPIILDRLVRKGALVLTSGGRQPTAPTAETYKGVTFSPADLAEPVDLTQDQKKRILFVEMHLTKWSHYRLLGISGKSSAADIKAAYLRASKEFHPDVFFRKRLGSYQHRLDKIFRALKQAYDQLSDPAVRADYDRRTEIELTPEEEAEAARKAQVMYADELKRERDERNAERLRDQRLKRNPLVDRLRKGRELMQHAMESRRVGKIDEAAGHARLAMQYDVGLAAQAHPLIVESDKLRGMAHARKLEMYFASGMESEELQSEVDKMLEEAAELATSTRDFNLVLAVSKLMFRANKLPRAAKLAQLSTELEPKNPRGWEQFAEVAAADLKWVLTLKACERWLTFEPRSRRAIDLQHKARSHTGTDS